MRERRRAPAARLPLSGEGSYAALLPASVATPEVVTPAMLTSPNVVLLGLLVALALVATFDPWYTALVMLCRGARAIYLVVIGRLSFRVVT